MKLAIDIRCLQDTWRTGVGEYTWQIVRALQNYYPSTDIVGYTARAEAGAVAPEIKQILNIASSDYNPRWQNLLYTLGAGRGLDDILLTKMNIKPDIWWLPNPAFCKFTDEVPTVLTVHDLAIYHYPEFFKWRGRLWYFPYLRQLLKKMSRHKKCAWVAVSPHTAQDMADYFPQIANSITIIPPAISNIYYERVSLEIRNQVNNRYRLERPYLLSVGTIEPRKNYNLLLKVYELLLQKNRNFPYDLVIAGAWGWKNKSFKSLLAIHPARERVHVLGYVNEADKPALYQGANLFLYPSYYEGFGIPVLEAMASKVPVICSNISSLPDLVQDAGLLLDPREVGEWVEAIEWLTQDQSACADYINKAIDLARQYAWEKSALEYYKLFTKVYASSN